MQLKNRISHQALMSLVFAIGASLLALDGATAQDADEAVKMRLRLKDGSFSMGQIVGADDHDRLGWKIDGFQKPFQFETRAIRSVSAIGGDGTVAASTRGQLLTLSDGALVAGRLLQLDEERVVVESPILGNVTIERGRVLSISDAGYAGEVVYSGPMDDDRWRRIGKDSNWEFEAGALVAKVQGAAVIGNVDLPDKAQVNLVLSWKGVADFVFSFGTENSAEQKSGSDLQAAARLEVWDKQLALVREVPLNADIALLSDLNGANQRVELTLYIDQTAGTISVCDAHGRPLESIHAEANEPTVRNSVHLINHGPGLTLEKFEVRKWDGHTAMAAAEGNGQVLTDEKELLEASIIGYDNESRQLKLAMRNVDEERELDIDSLERGDLMPMELKQAGENAGEESPQEEDATDENASDEAVSSTASEKIQPDGAQLERDANREIPLLGSEDFGFNIGPTSATSEEAEDTKPNAEAAQLEVVLSDRTRLRGDWIKSEGAGSITMRVPGIRGASSEFVSFSPKHISGIIGSSNRYLNNLADHKNGTIRVGDSQIAGYLDQDVPTADGYALRWHPYASKEGSPLNRHASGAIIYRKSLPSVNRNSEMFLRRPRRASQASRSPNSDSQVEREIMFRTGDAIHGFVKSIDDKGMVFGSEQTTTEFASHKQIQSVSLNPQQRAETIPPAKLKRLMTVPRSMKLDPPTHLFIAVSGDFLRGRLVAMDEKTITVEIRLELTQIPRDQVAQIVWLHDRDWDNPTDDDKEQDVEDQDQKFRVHAIGIQDQGLTFAPEEMTGGVLSGTSDLLGACSVEVGKLNQLLFGSDIGSRIREFREDPWSLSLAQYPRVYQENSDAPVDSSSGQQSELVGRMAPEFGLDKLDGERFNLKKQRGKILVLDFWASWCGPCIQTMPLVEAAVAEVGGNAVELVAVNIQETPNRVHAAVDRLQLEATVLLDTDGEVAAAYQANAIPQTVIIDAEGRIRYLFVGGGPRFVAQFRAALMELLDEAASL